MTGRSNAASSKGFINSRSGRGLACAAAISLLALAGCDEDEALRTFRDAASPVFFDGLSTLVGGLIDGLDAVVQDGVDTANDGASAEGGDTTTGETAGG